MIEKTKQHFKIPVYVGFGISNRQQAKEVIGLGADGVIVGSAICKMIEEKKDISYLDLP